MHKKNIYELYDNNSYNGGCFIVLYFSHEVVALRNNHLILYSLSVWIYIRQSIKLLTRSNALHAGFLFVPSAQNAGEGWMVLRWLRHVEVATCTFPAQLSACASLFLHSTDPPVDYVSANQF